MAISGKNSAVRVTSDPVGFTGASTSSLDDKTYTLDNTLYHTLDYKTDIIVYEDGVETLEDFVVKKLKGEIVFDAIDATRGVITVDGNYLPTVEVAKAREYSFTMNASMEDSTTFKAEFVSKTPTLKSVEATVDGFYDVLNQYTSYILEGDVLVLELKADDDLADGYKFFVRLSSEEISSGVSGLVGRSLTFEGTDDLVVLQ